MKVFYSFIIFTFINYKAFAQSFSDEKTSAINFVKRVYASSPFEGVKKLEGESGNYYAIAVTLMNIPNDSVLSLVPKAQSKAQIIAEQGFAEPCVKFEMIDYIENGQQLTYLFLYTTLDDFITDVLKKKLVDILALKDYCSKRNIELNPENPRRTLTSIVSTEASERIFSMHICSRTLINQEIWLNG